MLNQRKKELKAEVTTSESVQIVSFSLVNELNKKKENYGVPIEQVKEIRSFENITNVPNAKHFVKGIMNLRGMIIPVVDVKKRLGFGETKELNKNHRILIADVRDSVYGLIVDNVDQVLQITIKDIEPIPPDSFESHHYIKGIAKVKGKLIVLLDIIALFEFEQDLDNSNDQQEIEELKTLRNNSEIENENIQAKNLESTTENDIPDVLKEVFKEDEEKNSLKESTS
jgi:purine-binding chemotaxis protein CheW